jgi:hypothetical protein
MPVAKPVLAKSTKPALAKAAVAAPAAKPTLAVAKATAAPAKPVKAEKVATPAGERASRIAGELEGKKVTLLVAENPKREGTNAAAMWELYKKGMTYAQLREAGVSVADIHWNIKHEFITFA